MNHKEAEKLLSALIFGDLDKASKNDLTAYLQTDEELRERLADMRMAVKVSSDALQHGPDPVLDKHRLKRLAKLAGHSSRRPVIFSVRSMAAAAAVLIVIILPLFIFMPSLSKVKHLKPGLDIAGGTSSRYDVEFTGGNSAEISLNDEQKLDPENLRRLKSLGYVSRGVTRGYKFDDSKSDVYYSITEKFMWGKEVPASIPAQEEYAFDVRIAREVKFGSGVDSVDGYGGRGGGVDGSYADSIGKGVQNTLYNDGHVTYESDGDDIVSKITEKIGGGVYRGGSVALSDSGRQVEKSNIYTYNEPVIAMPAKAPPLYVGTPKPAEVAKSKSEAGSVNYHLSAKPELSAKENGKPSDIIYNKRTAGYEVSAKVRAASETISNRPIASSGITYGRAAIKHNKETELSMNNFTISGDKLQVEVDSATDGDIVKLGKIKKVPLMGDIPIIDGIFKQDVKKQIVGAEEMGSINEIIVSSGEKEGMVTEGRTGLGLDRNENDFLKVVNDKEHYARVNNFDTPFDGDESNLPLASGFKSVPVNPWVMSQRDRLSTFGLDVDTASYTLSRRYIYNGFLPPAGAVRMEEFVNYFNYQYPQRNDRTFTVHAEAAASPFADKGKYLTLLKVGVKARTIGRDQQKPAHLILVIDTSASMGKPDRLPLVQQSLNLLIDKLSASDRVTLITCANESRLHLEATSVQHRDRIRQAINAVQPSGSTNLLAGLKLGYAIARRSFNAKQINHVVLCSDGVANVGQTESELVLNEVAEDRKQGITITCVGVGFGSYNDVFMESLANHGDGSYVFLDSAHQGQKVFVEQLAATMHTVAKDARIQVSFNPDRVRRYRLIGYENRDIEDNRFRDDTVDAGEVGSGQCSSALYELELTGQRSSDQGDGLGTVFVRYRHADTGRMEEISYTLKSSIVQRRKVESSPRFFLAAAASQFAEILRQSEHARNSSLTDVLALAEKVSLALPLDRDVRDLTELIRKAEHLPRSQ